MNNQLTAQESLINVPMSSQKAVSVCAGSQHNIALMDDLSVWTGGSHSHGQRLLGGDVGDGQGVSQIPSSGGSFETCQTKPSGHNQPHVQSTPQTFASSTLTPMQLPERGRDVVVSHCLFLALCSLIFPTPLVWSRCTDCPPCACTVQPYSS